MAVNNELGNTWHKAVTCKAPLRLLPGGTEENHKELQTGQLVPWPRFDPGASHMQAKQALLMYVTFICNCLFTHVYILQHVLRAIIISCVLFNRNGQNGELGFFSLLTSV